MILLVMALLVGCAGATKVTKASTYKFNLYTDANVLKGTLTVPGLLDYEFKNNVLYTITANKFCTYYIPDPSKPINPSFTTSGNFWDIDLVSGTQSGSVFLATGAGMRQYFIKSSTYWKAPIFAKVYQPGLTIKTVVADSGGVKLYALNGQKFQYLWKSDGYLIITDAWL